MLIDADCTPVPDSHMVRCRRLRPEGGVLEIGILHVDHDQREYRVQPAGGTIDDTWHRTMRKAMDALYELVVEELYERRARLRDELIRVREDLALLDGLD